MIQKLEVSRSCEDDASSRREFLILSRSVSLFEQLEQPYATERDRCSVDWAAAMSARRLTLMEMARQQTLIRYRNVNSNKF